MVDPLSVPATPDAQKAIGEFVTIAAASAGLDETAAQRLRGAVSAAVSDALARRYRGAAEDDLLRVSAGIDQSALTVSLEDRRLPGDPAQAPDAAPEGVDGISRQRAGGWNCLTFAVHLAAAQENLDERSRQLGDAVIRVILPIGIALSGERDFDRLLERILRETKAICDADGGTLYLREGDDLRFVTMLNDSLGIAAGGTTGQAIDLPPVRLVDQATGELNHRNVASCAALRGSAINVPDIHNAEHYDFSGTRRFDEANGYRSISSLTIPLKDHTGEVIGVLQLLNAQDRQTGQVVAFDAYMQQVAEALASQAAVVLNNRMLLKRQEALLQFERELQIGREMQANFLPTELSRAQGWEIAAEFRPAREVGGDFYDTFSMGGADHVALVVADVCGKGLGAALFMALVRTLIRAFAGLCSALPGGADCAGQEAPSLVRVVELANSFILNNHADASMFATLFFGVLDTSTGSLTYVNAGHNPPLVIRAGGSVARLGSDAPAVGMFDDVSFVAKEVTIQPGDTLVAYTDGLTEAQNERDELYGDGRLLEVVKRPITSATGLAEAIAGALDQFVGSTEQSDDVTLLICRRMAGP